jgi:PilZ domain
VYKDKRKNRRQSVRYTAWVVLPDGKQLSCLLSDISDAGARVNLPDTGLLPDDFVLLLAINGAARRACHVIWRTPKQLGVTFKRIDVSVAGSTPEPKAETKPDAAPIATEAAPST